MVGVIELGATASTNVSSAKVTTLSQSAPSNEELLPAIVLCSRPSIFTLVIPDVLSSLLTGYQEDLVSFLINGFIYGFRLGFSKTFLCHSLRNNTSAFKSSNDVSKAILKELQRGHTSGPFISSPLPDFHCSPLGSAIKKDGSARVILDLSSPQGYSVNDSIPLDICHVKYNSFDNAVDMVNTFGSNCVMAKICLLYTSPSPRDRG